MQASLGLERKNPLPVGRYWVFRLGAEQIAAFDQWVNVHRRMKALRVIASEFDQESKPIQTFTVFEVLAPNAVVWQGPGLPDRAPAHVTSSQDVVQAPVVPSGAERLENALKGALGGGETLSLLLFGAAVLYLMSQKGSSHHELRD